MAVMDYRTQDGLANYGFSIEYDTKSGWRVYIVFQPFYRSDHNDLRLPHQAIDCNGRRYVDWPSKLDSLGDAKTVAALWAEHIQSYGHVTAKETTSRLKNAQTVSDRRDVSGNSSIAYSAGCSRSRSPRREAVLVG